MRAAASIELCLIEDCRKPAELRGGGLCAAHRFRKKHERPLLGALRTYSRSPLQALKNAGMKLADSDTDEAFKRANKNFDALALRWLKAYLARRARRGKT